MKIDISDESEKPSKVTKNTKLDTPKSLKTEDASLSVAESEFSDQKLNDEVATEMTADKIEPEAKISTEETEDIDTEKLNILNSENDTDGFEIKDFTDDVELDPEKTIEEIVSDTEQSSVDQTQDVLEDELDDISIEEDLFKSEDIPEVDTSKPAEPVKKERNIFKRAFKFWWNHKIFRNISAGLILIAVAATMLIPDSRYLVLNSVGVRVESSVRVIDSQTRRPLRNISVSFQGNELKTNEEGIVGFTNLKLGKSELIISKRGYAEDKSTIVLGWGSNPLADKALQATGEQYVFVLSDWQSNTPITEAEAVAGENSATADENGKIVLIIGEEDISTLKVSIMADGYRTEELSVIELNDSERLIKMVPGRRHAFVSNRDGKFDLYAVDIDGKNEKLILEATEKERQTPLILSHPSRNLIALVSSRNGDLNSDGFSLDGLFLVNTESGEEERIGRSERIKLLGWSGDTLVYWQIVEGTSASNPLRSKLIAYDEKTKERRDIASSNYFNDVELIGDTVYYAVSSFAVPQSQAKLYSTKISSSESKTLIDKQVWNTFRTSYDVVLAHAEDQKWYEIKNELVREIESQLSPTPRDYINSPDGKTTAWVEIRDGKGTLLVSDIAEFKEDKKLSLAGLSEVMYWANNDQIVFQLISNSETADYFYSLSSGETQKIRDVTPSIRDNSY